VGSFLPRVAAFASRSAQLDSSETFENEDFAHHRWPQRLLRPVYGRSKLFALQGSTTCEKAVGTRTGTRLSWDALAEVRRAWVNLEETQQQLVLQRTTAELVQKNRDLVEKEYAAGQAALVRLNEAQRDLVAGPVSLGIGPSGALSRPIRIAHCDRRDPVGF
jgi:hypothetical protein